VNEILSPGDVRRQRRIRAAAASRPYEDHPLSRYTPEERAIVERIEVDRS
jgi:hypothetical protein